MQYDFLSDRRRLFAAAFAVVGVSLAIWINWAPHAGSRRAARAPAAVVQSTPEEAAREAPVQFGYRPIQDVEAAEQAVRDLQQTVFEKARRDTELAKLGEEAVESFARAAMLVFRPLVVGSGHGESIEALGGVPPDSRYLAMFETQRQEFALRPVAIEGARIISFARGGVERTFEETHRTVMEDYGSLPMALGTRTNPKRYPAVASFRKRRLDAYEVRVPMMALAYKRPDVELAVSVGIALVWDPDARRWQPVQSIIVTPPIHSADDPDIRPVVY